MIQIAFFIAITLLGVGVGKWTEINPITQSFFPVFTSFALVVGLYGSVMGIDLNAIRNRKRVAVVVITIAVPLQIVATGLVMHLIYPVAISFLLAVAITQIDPLSVDTLLRDKESMSDEAKGLLRVWASFDDPVTVLFGFLILMPLVSDTTVTLGGDALSFGVGLIVNLLPAVLLWGLSRWSKVLDNQVVSLILLLLTLTFAFFVEAYLLAAITGLLLRPELPKKYLPRIISVLYYIIVFVVGMAIYNYGVDLRLGILLAIVEFFVIQPMTAIIVFNGTASDLLRIAFAQQNGLTTLLMGIAFQSLGFEVLHILLPAIVIINVLNLVVNKIYHQKEIMGLATR